MQQDSVWPAQFRRRCWRASAPAAVARCVSRYSRWACGAMTAEIDAVVGTRTRDEWAPVLDRYELIWAPVQTAAEALNDAQAHAIGAFAPVDHPNIPECRVVNSPIEFGDVNHEPHRAAPELGQHTEEVALEVGLSWDDLGRL